MTVWKFALNRTDLQDVLMPEGASVLHIAMQDHKITLWAWVDPEAETVLRRFAIVGTGNPAPAFGDAMYHGTVMDGPFVWHIFERDA